jgi:hypothetical protein
VVCEKPATGESIAAIASAAEIRAFITFLS